MQVCRDFFLVLSHQFQKFFHRFGRLLFGSRIKVRIDVGRRAEIAVPQPLLNLFERHTMRQQQRCAAVAQVVKADMPQVVLLQRFAEAAGKICWANPFPQFIDANVICKLPAVRLTADFSVLFLLFLQSEKHFSHSRHKRQGTAAGASLGRVRRDNLVLPVNRASSHCVPNANGVMHKVNGIPAQAHHLAAAQTIEGCQFHRHFNQRI